MGSPKESRRYQRRGDPTEEGPLVEGPSERTSDRTLIIRLGRPGGRWGRVVGGGWGSVSSDSDGVPRPVWDGVSSSLGGVPPLSTDPISLSV